MNTRQKVVVAIIAVVLAGAGWYLFLAEPSKREPIQLTKDNTSVVPEQNNGPINQGPVGPISGLPCENWNRRPFAVMQPVDLQARPVAGFSQADMVFEMPNPATGVFVTRLMGVYQCGNPPEIGSMRSARHDYIHIAKGLDAIFVGWGGSAFAIKKLDEGVIDNLDCNGEGGKNASVYCFRKERTGLMRVEDTGYAKFDQLIKGATDSGYRMENKFSGYPHQEDAPLEARPEKGYLRIGFPGIMEAEYNYDKATNSYPRTWGGAPDIDRNNNQRIAPKNIAVLFAENEQILNTVDYAARGVEDPWSGLEAKKTGIGNISGRYNNIQLGDPWYDTQGSGDAYYYLNGKQYRGKWQKDRRSAESKLMFLDESNNEIKFVPGLIWVEVLVPGQAYRWEGE